MENEEKLKLNNISSEYCLKAIFTFLDYNYILKLIKYNKKLQNKIGFNKYNYKNLLNYQYITRKITRKIKIINNYENYQKIFFISIITLAPITYILTFSSILYFEGSFNENNLKENYNEKYLNIINKINTSLYLLEAHILFSYFIIVCFIFNNYYFDNMKLKKIKYTILLIINSIYYFFELLIIWKIFLSYKIKKGKIPWFMTCDYILISIILLYIIFMLYLTYKYIKFAGSGVLELNKTILKKYKNIIINDFELPNNFHKMSKQNKRRFILDNAKKFKYTHSKRHINIINKINEFRINNRLQALAYNEEEKLPFFIINEFPEVIIFQYKNIFKLKDKKYLFKYNKGEFLKNFEKNDIDIINIILNENINRINIIDIDKFEFIFFFDFDPIDDFKVNLIEAENTTIPIEQEKDLYYEIIEDLSYNE